jgi:putative addiction module antidote
MELKLRNIGNSLGLVLPKEMLSKLKLVQGDKLWVTESPEGYQLTPYDPEFSNQIETARKIMKKRRNVLHELAK